jgi:hypothetical protein
LSSTELLVPRPVALRPPSRQNLIRRPRSRDTDMNYATKVVVATIAIAAVLSLVVVAATVL